MSACACPKRPGRSWRTKDSGTLQYDMYLNDDQSECMVIERYRDSEAAMEHAAKFLGDLFAAVLATVSVVHGELLGEPSAGAQSEPGRQRRAGSLHSVPHPVGEDSDRSHGCEWDG